MSIPAVKEEIKDITKIIFIHKSGAVGCDKGRENRFGCKDVGYGIYLTNDKKQYAPDFNFDKTIKVIGKDGSNNMFWEVDGKQDSLRLEF